MNNELYNDDDGEDTSNSEGNNSYGNMKARAMHESIHIRLSTV